MLITITPPQRSFSLKTGSPSNFRPLDLTIVRCKASLVPADAYMTVGVDLVGNYSERLSHADGATTYSHAMSEFVVVTRTADNWYRGIYFHQPQRIQYGDPFAPYQHGDLGFIDTLIAARINGASSVAVDCENSYTGVVVHPDQVPSRRFATMIRGVCSYINETGWDRIGNPVDAIILAVGAKTFSALEENFDRLTSKLRIYSAER